MEDSFQDASHGVETIPAGNSISNRHEMNIGSEYSEAKEAGAVKFRQDTGPEEESIPDDDEFGFPSFDGVPSYQLPSFAGMVGSFGSIEQDYVKQAYNSASFTSIRTLPDYIRYGEVYLARQNHILKSQLANSPFTASQTESRHGSLARKSVAGVARTKALRLFQEFDYIPSRYSLPDEAKARERLLAEAKRLQIGGRNFMPASSKYKGKYEDTFEDEEYRYPYCSDPFDQCRDQRLRDKWIEASKVLHGPFKPSGKVHLDLSKPTVALQKEIVNRLTNMFRQDWEEAEVEVSYDTESKWIVARFSATSVESINGLQAYMNILVSSDPDVCSWGLKKVPGSWGLSHSDGYRYYCFLTSW